MDRKKRAENLLNLARNLLSNKTAAPAQTADTLRALLSARVDSLLDLRVAIRKDCDKLHAAYDDATGGYGGGIASQGGGFASHANPAVKEARDALHKLDNEIGTTYRTLEHLMYVMREASKAKGAATKVAVDDPDFVVQGLSGGYIMNDYGSNDEEKAIEMAKKLLRSPYFEGTSVRVLTRDGEMLWEASADKTEEAALSASKKAATPGAHHSVRPWRLKVHVGPVGIKEYAEKFQDAGIPVDVAGTEHLHINMDGTDAEDAKFNVLKALEETYGPRALGVKAKDIASIGSR